MLFNRLLVPKMHLSIRWYIIGQRESRLVILSHHQVASLSSKAWRVNPVALWSKFKFCPKWENCDPGRRWKAVVEIGGKLLEDWQHTGSGGHRPEPEVEEAQSETIAWQKLTCVVLLGVAFMSSLSLVSSKPSSSWYWLTIIIVITCHDDLGHNLEKNYSSS